jgi:charged multivesicular body protein 2A
MGNVFGKDKPLKDVLRENKRMITRAIRELDREKTGLEREEKRLTMEIKKAAREQQMSSVRIMAKVKLLFLKRIWWYEGNYT